jgi:nucleoside-diphosphate-sugar epimerase
VTTALPDRIETVERLEDLLSEPSPAAVEAFRRLPGDVVILGAAGKMGPTLARMARRAADAAGTSRRVIAVSRFSEPGAAEALARYGVETVRADLLDDAGVAALPPAPLVVYMAGQKFGTAGAAGRTWAMNAFVPGLVARRYRGSRIAAFSTGNVYGLVPVAGGGSKESDVPNPAGEYAQSCLGRERIFEHFARADGTPVSILRLNYATELRYGVIVDVALKVAAGEPVDLAMGWFNAIWQADASAMALASLADAATPPFVVNLAGPETLRVREVAAELARLMGRAVEFRGAEAPDALLSDGAAGREAYGAPRVTAERMIRWIADWVGRSGATLGKPTHFEARDGKY